MTWAVSHRDTPIPRCLIGGNRIRSDGDGYWSIRIASIVNSVRLTIEEADSHATQLAVRFPFRNRFEHCLRVSSIAAEIAITERTDLQVAVLAGLFHDAGKSAGEDHAAVGADFAERSLQKHNVLAEKVTIIVDCVRHHSHGISSESGRFPEHLAVLRDADILDEVGALGIGWTLMGVSREVRSYTDAFRRLAELHHADNAEARIAAMRTPTGKNLMRRQIDRELRFVHEFREELRLELPA